MTPSERAKVRRALIRYWGDSTGPGLRITQLRIDVQREGAAFTCSTDDCGLCAAARLLNKFEGLGIKFKKSGGRTPFEAVAA